MGLTPVHGLRPGFVRGAGRGVRLSDLVLHDRGPLEFIQANWTGSVRQYTIGDLLSTTPYGEIVGGPSAFIGSWWSLRFEVICYLGLALLGALGLLRSRWVVGGVTLCLGICCWALVLAQGWSSTAPSLGHTPSFPLIGALNIFHLLFLSYLFLLGVCARTWSHHIPISGTGATLAAATFVATVFFGGLLTVGLICYAYLIFWLTVALPTRLHRVGRRHDYSYGVYVYGFGVQQAVALAGGAQWGFAGYFVVCLIGTVVLAALSWHWVEAPALRWKDWTPSMFGRPVGRLRQRESPDSCASSIRVS